MVERAGEEVDKLVGCVVQPRTTCHSKKGQTLYLVAFENGKVAVVKLNIRPPFGFMIIVCAVVDKSMISYS